MTVRRNVIPALIEWRRGAAFGNRADRVVARLLAASLLHLAGAGLVSAEEFRTPSISAVRVEWRAVLDQLRAEINTQPSVASAFTFASQRRVTAHDPRATPALVQLNAHTAPILDRHRPQPNSRIAAVRHRQLARSQADRRDGQPVGVALSGRLPPGRPCSTPAHPATTRCSRSNPAPAKACRSGRLQGPSRCRSPARCSPTILPIRSAAGVNR